MLLRNLDDYFTGEWLKHDPKTKGNILSCVTNLFGDVTRNEQLIKTFCQPSRFSFEDCLNNGKVYTLVLSAYPNAQMLIGTCMKLDFQQVVLKRTQAAPVNKNRFLLFLADEYQFFITTSGERQDGRRREVPFRSAPVPHLQPDCHPGQVDAAGCPERREQDRRVHPVLWLARLPPEPGRKDQQAGGANVRAVLGEKADHSGADLKLSSAFSEGRSGSTTRRQEKMNRFDASHFTQMAPFEAVILQQGAADGQQDREGQLEGDRQVLG